MRKIIAQRWGIAPPDVERYPNHEIETEIRLIGIEARAEREKGKR